MSLSMVGLVLLSLLVAYELWRAHLRFWKKRFSLRMSYALEEKLSLPDGGAIELRRLARAPGSPRDLHPVLLVHGIAVNHRNNDPTPDRSFARFLSSHGRDVWLLTLRSGLRHAPFFADERHCFRAMRDHDLPHAVRAVLTRTGAAQLDLVCYSMGGMVLYAALGRSLDAGLVRRTVVFASPGRVRPLGPVQWASYLPRSLTPTVPLRLVMRTLAFAHRVVPRFILRMFLNPPNVPRQVVASSMTDMFEDIPGALGADFVRWASRGGEVTIDGEPILEGLRSVEVPVLFFAGKLDFLAPPDSVRAAYEAWGKGFAGVDKQFVLLAPENGTRHEYGHGDFAFGLHARDEVYVPAARFLQMSIDADAAPRGILLEPEREASAAPDDLGAALVGRTGL